jgi:3-hydroxybutyryl-CoA dehydrogenase
MTGPAQEGATIAVVGLGTMGSGIAQVAAAAGCRVVAIEADSERLQAGRTRIAEFLAEGVRRGKLSDAERTATFDRIEWFTEVGALAGADLVIEAIVEDRSLKLELLPRIAGAAGEEAIIATNTSALSVTELAAAVGSPARFAGMHFFNPAPLMPLVEIVSGELTAPATTQTLERWVEAFGKTPVRARDRPGFLVNRLLMPYLNQVAQAFDDGLASATDIDLSLELGLGYPMGGLRLLDLIGIDNHLHATSAAYEASKEPSLAPPPILRRMVDAGLLGAKSGRGFHALDEGDDQKGAA